MRKAIISAIAATVLLAGCQAPQTPPKPKWEGAPYRLTLGAQPTKSNPAGVTLPPIYYTANPEAVRRRINLVMRIDTTGLKNPGKAPDEILMKTTDISGPRGELSASYLDDSSAALAKLLSVYCLKGNVTVKIALVDSIIMITATDAQVDNHRLTDWQPIVLVFKNPHPRC